MLTDELVSGGMKMKNVELCFSAKAFFNTYLNLRTSDDINFFIPMVVNGAFSVELALKSILTENDIDFSHTHNLFNLFFLLPDDLAIEFINNSFERAPAYRQPDKWAEELLAISETFEQYRYMHERKPLTPIQQPYFDSLVFAAFETMTAHYNVDIVEAPDKQITEAEIDTKAAVAREKSIESIRQRLRKIKTK